MKIDAETAWEIVCGCQGWKQLAEEPLDKHRWYMVYRYIFEHEGKLYGVFVNMPATEIQEDMDRFDEDPVEFFEVKAVEKTVVVYEAV